VAAADYVDFLASVTPENQDEYMAQMKRFNMGLPGEADCPVFDGVFEYCQVRCRRQLPALVAVTQQLAGLPARGPPGQLPAWGGGNACTACGDPPAPLPRPRLQTYSGASVDGAASIAAGDSTIALNWAGERPAAALRGCQTQRGTPCGACRCRLGGG
jgi:hypothetical protein